MNSTRRDFLYSTAALTAAGMTAKSYAAIAGANDRINLGIIGTGRRAVAVTGLGFNHEARVRIVALCDVYPKMSADFAKRFSANISNPAFFTDYHDLLARKDIDSVYIATPDHLHQSIACAALQADKNVYLEKPTAHRYREIGEIKACADASKHVLQCGMQQRSGHHYMQAKQEYFDTGKLGHVVFVRATWNNFPWQTRNLPTLPKPADLRWDLFLGPAPKVAWEWARYTSWRAYHDYGNGVLADIMTHWVDVAQWLMSDPNPQKATVLGGDYVLTDDRTNPDTVSAIVQYKNWNFNFESTILTVDGPPPGVFFEGTEGTLNITREGYDYKPNKGGAVHVDNKQPLEEAHVKSFADAVLTGSKQSAPIQAGIEATIPVEMALKSYWDKKTITRADLTT
jgi:predicted dehydrogenase